MNPQDPKQVLCTLLGIAPINLAIPCQILKLPPCERNPADIDQAARICFARVQAAQHLVGTDTMRWMMQVIADARNSMLNAAAVLRPQEQFHPVPPQQWMPQPTAPCTPPAAESMEPPIVIRAPRPRRRSGGDMENVAGAIGGLLMCGLLVMGASIFVTQWWSDLNRLPKKTPSVSLVWESTPDRGPVKQGGGRPASGDGGTVATNHGQVNPAARPMAINDERKAAAREYLTKAMKMAGSGSFEEGHRLANKARQAMPDESEGSCS